MPTPKARPTRPRPDDPAIIERFSNAIRIGHPISTAAELAGIGDTRRLSASISSRRWGPSS